MDQLHARSQGECARDGIRAVRGRNAGFVPARRGGRERSAGGLSQITDQGLRVPPNDTEWVEQANRNLGRVQGGIASGRRSHDSRSRARGALLGAGELAVIESGRDGYERSVGDRKERSLGLETSNGYGARILVHLNR